MIWTDAVSSEVRSVFGGLEQWVAPGFRHQIVERAPGTGERLPEHVIEGNELDLGDLTLRVEPLFGFALEPHAWVQVIERETAVLPMHFVAVSAPSNSQEDALYGFSKPPNEVSVATWQQRVRELQQLELKHTLVGCRIAPNALRDTHQLLAGCFRDRRLDGIRITRDRLYVDPLLGRFPHAVIDLVASYEQLELKGQLRRRLDFGNLGKAPHQIAVNRATGQMAFAIAGSDQVYAGEAIRVEGTPLGVQFRQDGDVIATQFAQDSAVLIHDQEIVESLTLGEGPSLLAGPLPFDRFLVSCERSNQCVLLDASRFEVLARFPTGNRPFPPGFTRDGRLAFVPNHDDSTVTVIDLWNEVVVATVDVGSQPTGALVLPNETDFETTCLIACRGSNEVVGLDIASRRVRYRTSLPGGPFSLVFEPRQELVYVNLSDSDEIGVLSPTLARQPGGRPALLSRHPCDDLPICLAIQNRQQEGQPNALWVSHEDSNNICMFEADIDIPWEPLRRHLGYLPFENQRRTTPDAPPSALGVFGMIHRGHKTSEVWGTEQLEAAIRAFNPDVVITEIPPDRWHRIWRDYASRGVYEDPRIQPFVEYTDVLLPLKVELGFEIEPCAAWTTEMNNLRRARIKEFNESEEFAERRAAYQEAERIAEEQTTLVDTEDPFVIHTDEYDQAMAIRLGPYDSYLNEHIGPGGWTNINRSHADLIEAAVARHPGKRVLITFGAGHKYWIQNRLRRRGYALEDMRDYLPR
ncbi:MAG: hypothetical protein AAF196_10240 [Planctomycetota bacterium]